MSANLEHDPDRLLIPRVGGELKKSELDAVQSEFVEKIAGEGTVKLLVLLENVTGWERGEQWGKGPVKFFPETGESEARAWLAG